MVLKVYDIQKSQQSALHFAGFFGLIYQTKITNAYDCVCIEDLDMKAMSRSLNFRKSVSDNGWGMFTTFLRYKLEEQGKKLVKVDRFFASSQTCSVCGYKNAKTKNLALKEWDCPQCRTRTKLVEVGKPPPIEVGEDVTSEKYPH